MFVVARKITRRRFGLGVVVPAWSAGTQIHTDVSGGVLAAWMPAVRAGMTEVVPLLPVEFVGCSPIGEPLFPSVVWEKACIATEGLRLALDYPSQLRKFGLN